MPQHTKSHCSACSHPKHAIVSSHYQSLLLLSLLHNYYYILLILLSSILACLTLGVASATTEDCNDHGSNREASTLTRKKRIESFAGAEGELARIDQLRKSKMEASSVSPSQVTLNHTETQKEKHLMKIKK